MISSTLLNRLIPLLGNSQGTPEQKCCRFFIDLWLVTCLVWLGISAATGKINEFRASGQAPAFYQISFEPAVLMACGREFGVSRIPIPSLVKFLQLKVDRFSCNDLPTDLKINSRVHQTQWFYMMKATSYLWKLTGVSWSKFDYLPALFVGLSIALIYGFFRLAFSAPIAMFGAVYVFFTQSIVVYTPFFRDLSKTPFILAALLILAVLVKRDRLYIFTVPLVMLAGVIIGIGYGFRPDVVILIPLFLISVLVFLPGYNLREMMLKLGVLVGFLVSFFVAAYPMISMANDVGTCSFHWAILGTGTAFLPSLGLQPGAYGLVHQFNDMLAWNITASHSNRFFNIGNPGYCTPAYDQASGSLFLKMLLTFPADFITRAYLSIYSVLTSLHDPYFGLSKYSYPIATLFCILVAYIRSIRIGIHLTLIVAFLCAYPAVQFNFRHYYHLQFIPVFFLMFAIMFAVVNVPGIVTWIKQSLHEPTSLNLKNWNKLLLTQTATKIAAFFAVVFLLPVLVFQSARLYQAHSLQNIVDIYSGYPWRQINLTSKEIAPDKTQYPIPIPKEAAATKGWPTRWHQTLYRVSVHKGSCEEPPSEIKIIYKAKHPGYDFAHSLHNSSDRQKALNGEYYFQGYYMYGGSLAALEVSKTGRSCIRSISVLGDSKQPDFWVDLNVIDGRLNGQPYLTRQ